MKYARIEAGRIVSIGQCADIEQVATFSDGTPVLDNDGNEQREIVSVVPVGCIGVTDAEYSAMQEDIPDPAIIAAIVARAA